MYREFDSVRESVTRGADWLDDVYPEWLDRVDLDYLSVASSVWCVVGQAFRPTHDSCDGFKLLLTMMGYDYRQHDQWLAAHGFTGVCYGALTDTWREEIQSRRLLRAAVAAA
jgi:hypothetical protein